MNLNAETMNGANATLRDKLAEYAERYAALADLIEYPIGYDVLHLLHTAGPGHTAMQRFSSQLNTLGLLEQFHQRLETAGFTPAYRHEYIYRGNQIIARTLVKLGCPERAVQPLAQAGIASSIVTNTGTFYTARMFGLRPVADRLRGLYDKHPVAMRQLMNWSECCWVVKHILNQHTSTATAAQPVTA